MRQMETFFDPACPFCLQGLEYLKELLPEYPDVEIVWQPCEAHPRPESYGRHTDLCIQGFFIAVENGVDPWLYNDRMFEAALKRRAKIDDVETLVDIVSDILDPNVFRNGLTTGKYAQRQLSGNDHAYEESGVWAVPSFRMNGHKLDSIEGVGVSKAQLGDFLNTAGE